MYTTPLRCMALLVTTGAALSSGCGSVLDPGVWHMKQAAPYKVASMWKPTTERPSREAIEGVQRDGPERYVRRMYELLPYPMAIHGIGWFGGLWDLHTIAPYLSSEDSRTRMVALAAFSRLAGAQFGGETEALRWWEENRAAIPPATRGRAKS